MSKKRTHKHTRTTEERRPEHPGKWERKAHQDIVNAIKETANPKSPFDSRYLADYLKEILNKEADAAPGFLRALSRRGKSLLDAAEYYTDRYSKNNYNYSKTAAYSKIVETLDAVFKEQLQSRAEKRQRKDPPVPAAAVTLRRAAVATEALMVPSSPEKEDRDIIVSLEEKTTELSSLSLSPAIARQAVVILQPQTPPLALVRSVRPPTPPSRRMFWDSIYTYIDSDGRHEDQEALQNVLQQPGDYHFLAERSQEGWSCLQEALMAVDQRYRPEHPGRAITMETFLLKTITAAWKQHLRPEQVGALLWQDREDLQIFRGAMENGIQEQVKTLLDMYKTCFHHNDLREIMHTIVPEALQQGENKTRLLLSALEQSFGKEGVRSIIADVGEKVLRYGDNDFRPLRNSAVFRASQALREALQPEEARGSGWGRV